MGRNQLRRAFEARHKNLSTENYVQISARYESRNTTYVLMFLMNKCNITERKHNKISFSFVSKRNTGTVSDYFSPDARFIGTVTNL